MSKLKDTISHIAPTLASALSGPYAGMAVKFIAEKLLGENETRDLDVSELEAKITGMLNDKECLKAIKQMEYDFKKEMQQLDVDVFALEVADRKSARELAQHNLRPQIYMSLSFLVCYFFLLFAMFYVATFTTYGKTSGQESLWDELQIFMGLLTAGVAQILNFWFGGSLGKKPSA